MATEWYYAVDGKRCGPVSSSKLKELSELGAVTSETQIWKHGLSEWIAASKVKGLIPDFPAVVPQFVVEDNKRNVEPLAPPRRIKTIPMLPYVGGIVGFALSVCLVCGIKAFYSAASDKSEAALMILGVFFSGIVAVLLVTLYVVPSIIAFVRNHPNKAPILVVNLLLGWTFLGWVVALVWSLTEVKSRVQQHFHSHNRN